MTEQPLLLFDWGDTLMRVFPAYHGPMCAWPKIETMPGARETLAALSANFRLALATNAADSQESEIWQALQRGGLDTLIRSVYCFQRLGCKKPSPQFFESILRDQKTDAGQALLIGDDFQADVLGANQCGLRAVWYNPLSAETRSAAQYRTIHHLNELPALLQDFFTTT
ncbi:MAG: HAD family hydrolase [Anaerolineales bacterium]